MKSNMKVEYANLCSHNVKYTSYLFGDDVPTLNIVYIERKLVTVVSSVTNSTGFLCSKGLIEVSLARIDLVLLVIDDPHFKNGLDYPKSE